MNSHQSVMPVFNSSPFVAEPQQQKSDCVSRNSNNLSGKFGVNGGEDGVDNSEGFVGVLEVYVHQARDIHNICIYQKQDVYAKLCLTSNPETTVSTQIINGGGKNPVFNENLRLNIRTLDSFLKCEIWMLSRVKNYLEDQLLGFTLVPLSEVLIGNGKLAKEFSLSSTDLFHSPAGFVELSLSFSGDLPEVLAIPDPHTTLAANTVVQDLEIPDSLPGDLDKIEFPDPKIVNENQLMVSEYYGIPCSNLDSQNSENLVTSGTDNHLSSDVVTQVVEEVSADNLCTVEIPKNNSPPSSESTDQSLSASIPAISRTSDTTADSGSPNHDLVSPLKEKNVGEAESDSSTRGPSFAFAQSVLNVKIEPEQTVVQQDIVDMYMKSMQQFTESLAKMKLPVDVEKGSTESGNSGSDQKLQASKGTSSRVFYGSRAFF